MLDDLEKNIHVNLLFDIYGKLLTNTQQKMIELYYHDDLSLGEISELEGVSRNAVFDSIKKGIKTLEDYEDKLHILAKEEKMNNFFEELRKTNLSKEQEELLKLIIEKEHE